MGWGIMIALHHTLTLERWKTFSLATQLMNIDSELARAQAMRNAKDETHAQNSFARALELADLTVAAQTNKHRQRELSRLREVIADVASASNAYNVTIEDIRDQGVQGR